MSRLMILEPHCNGHRMQYVRWIAREAVARGHVVQLATFANCLDHPLYLAAQRECRGCIQTLILPHNEDLQKGTLLDQPGLSKLVKRELDYHRLYSTFFRQLSANQRPDLVFVPYLDYCAYAMALLQSPFGDVPWGGIVMRPSFHLGPMGIAGPRSRLHWPKEKLFFRLLRNKALRALFSIDEALVRYVHQNEPGLATRLHFLPDPAEFNGTGSRKAARQKLGIPNDAVVVLVYGSLTTRKGIDSLLLATQQDNFPQQVHVLLAGRRDAKVRELLLSSPARMLREAGRLHEYDGFLSDEEQHTVFRAADVVWLGYKEHYAMSGVLVQAGAMGLPVVASTEGLVGWLTRKYKLGLDVPVDDAKAVAEAIASLAQSPGASSEYGENGRHFAALHTPENFGKALNDALQVDAALDVEEGVIP